MSIDRTIEESVRRIVFRELRPIVREALADFLLKMITQPPPKPPPQPAGFQPFKPMVPIAPPPVPPRGAAPWAAYPPPPSPDQEIEVDRRPAHTVGEVQIAQETDLAILASTPDGSHEGWFPKSQIHASSEVFKLDDEGVLVVTQWLANERKFDIWQEGQ